MKHIYVGQTKLRIVLNSQIDLGSCKECEICYQKPNGTEGSFIAHVLDAEKGTIFYDVTSRDELDMSGYWKLWPRIVFEDDRMALGRSTRVFVYDAGD
ncbi:hypothetical protein [Treponema sp.]|uniref:hypothetical protein n=1 Tax=Treponema sp. TaxID=166 RepID=UPI00298E0EA6|nr:hypothetical protein [Treponema sp.]MCQ2240446.1 hypothetical protein [Treponema sp.]